MRASATFIGILALFLASCDGLEPHIKQKDKDALAALKGPDTGNIESVLSAQATQAVSAGDFKKASQTYKQLADKYPDNVNYKLSLAESLRRSGEYNASLRVTDDILAKDPKNAAALENKGLNLVATGEANEAANALGEVMKIDPNRWRTLNGIGILFAMKGKYDGAVAYFQAALNASTDNPSVLNNAALTYAIDRQFPRAYEAFGRAKRHLDAGSPEMKHIDLNMALVYAIDGKLDEAEQTASPHLSKEALYNNMGFYSYLAKNNELAKAYLNMALTQSSTYYERAWKNLGALTGENSTVPAPDALAAPSSGEASSQQLAAPTGPQEVPLSDIPATQAQHVETVPSSEGMDEKKAVKETQNNDKEQIKQDEEKLAEDKKKIREDENKAKADKAKEAKESAVDDGKADAGKEAKKESGKEAKKATKKKTETKDVKKDKAADKKKDGEKKKPAKKEKAKKKTDDAAVEEGAKKDEPQVNPDIILLHKPKETTPATPAATPQSVWDAVKPDGDADKKELPPLPGEQPPPANGGK